MIPGSSVGFAKKFRRMFWSTARLRLRSVARRSFSKRSGSTASFPSWRFAPWTSYGYPVQGYLTYSEDTYPGGLNDASKGLWVNMP